MPRVPRPEEWQGVLTYVEQDEGEPRPVSWEVLGAGAELARALGVELGAVAVGEGAEEALEGALLRGAQAGYAVRGEGLHPYTAEGEAEAVRLVVERLRPEILLFPATARGREVASLVATRVETGLTADVTALSVDRERRLLEATRPTFGGKQMATIVCEGWRPQMATLRPGVFPLPPLLSGWRGEGRVVTFCLDFRPRVRVRRREGKVTEHPLERAEVVVAGGRGVGGRQGFALLRELADLLGGVVAGTRPAAEAGWISRDYQVGQTGRAVRPRLYVAVGISGAIQHVVGMQQAKHIVAINRDPGAPIMRYAHYAVVGDLFQVVPALIRTLRERKEAGGVRSFV